MIFVYLQLLMILGLILLTKNEDANEEGKISFFNMDRFGFLCQYFLDVHHTLFSSM